MDYKFLIWAINKILQVGDYADIHVRTIPSC